MGQHKAWNNVYVLLFLSFPNPPFVKRGLDKVAHSTPGDNERLCKEIPFVKAAAQPFGKAKGETKNVTF